MSARWSLHHGDCLPWLAAMPDKSVDCVITDPPYSERVHKAQRRASLPDGRMRVASLGFDHFTPSQIAEYAAVLARVARRWVLVFSDIESCHLWRGAIEAGGAEYVRTGVWAKPNSTPQFTGDRPAVAVEAVTIAHRKGKKRWNGGGARALWTHNIERDVRGKARERMHTTQKPLDLMLELVSLFSDPGETVLDPFAGSGTTGVAALRLGRQFVGAEKDAGYARTARERLEAEERGSTLAAARAGQLGLLEVER